MSQAFISYHHAQRKLARLLAHRIAADGHSVWWDRSDRPGDAWSGAVTSALARSACVVVIWSKQAAANPSILGEATAGFGRGALISVMSDRTAPPPPFDSAPVIDMQDWEGDSIDVAWIRLRDPIRAKMQTAEVIHVEGQPLPPQRPPAPPRATYQNAPLSLPPAAMLEEKRGPSVASALMILAAGGLAAAGWYYRDDVQQEASRWQAALQPETTVAAIPDAPYQPTPMSQAAPEAALPTETLPPAEAATPASAAPETVQTPATGVMATTRVSAERPGWDTTWVPPPVIRQIPRAPALPDPPFTDAAPAAQPSAVPSASQTPAAAVAVAPAIAVHRINLRQGRFVDLDVADPRRETDIWFSPDKSGDGLYLGVTNGSRMRVVAPNLATYGECARTGATLRRTPIAARDLARGLGVCLRTSANQLRVIHVEGIEGSGREKVLRMRLDAPR